MSIQTICLIQKLHNFSYPKFNLSYIGMVSGVWGTVDVIPLYIRAGLAPPPRCRHLPYIYLYIFLRLYSTLIFFTRTLLLIYNLLTLHNNSVLYIYTYI